MLQRWSSGERGRTPSSRAEDRTLSQPLSGVGPTNRQFLRTILLPVLIPLALSAFGPLLAKGEDRLPVLTQASQIRKLTAEEARRGYPVHLLAVVTYFDPGNDLFVQDSTGGIWVDLRAVQASLQPGQELDLYGVSADGFAPYVAEPHWRVVGQASIPSARLVSYAEMVSAHDDSLWVEAEGIIRSVRFDQYERMPMMVVATTGGQFEVYLKDHSGLIPTSLVDARVRLHGVCGASFNTKNQLISVRLYVPSLQQVSVIEAAPTEPFSLPTLPIASLGRFSAQGTESHRVKVRGTVSQQVPQRMLFITDATGALRIEALNPALLHPGDQVEAVGFPSSGEYSPVLKNALFRKVGSGPAPVPAKISAEQALKGDFDEELIEVEGRLQADTRDAGGHTLVLQSGQVIYDATVDQAAIATAPWPALPTGSQLRLRGICSIKADEDGHPIGFRLILDRPSAITVLKHPSMWTAQRVSGLLALLAAVLLLSVLWVLALRRRVGEQTATLRATLEATADGILVVNSRGVIVTYNRKFAEMWGVPESVFKQRHYSVALKFVAAKLKDPEAFAARLKEIYADSEAQSDDVVELKDGRVFERHSEPQRLKGKNAGRVWGYRDITLQKRIEQELQGRQEYLNALLDSMHAGLLVIDPADHTIVDANSYALEMTGAAREDVVGRLCHGFVCPAELGKCPITDLHQTVDHSERWLLKTNGEKVPILKSVYPLVQRGRRFLVEAFVDITERKRAEVALRELSDQLDLALSSARAGTWSLSLVHGTLRWDSHVSALYGLEPGDPKQDYYPYLRTCVHPDDLRIADQLVTRSAQETVPFECEFRVTWPDGTLHVVANRGEVYREEGKPVRIIGVAWDVTDRKRMEDALIEERQLLRTLMDNVPDMIYFKDRESRFIRISKAHAKVFGLSDPAQAIGKTDFDFFGDQHARQAFADEQEIMRSGQPVLAKEERETWPDGRETWALSTKLPWRDTNGNIIGTFGLSLDITDRKRAERQLEERTAYLNALVENSPVAIVVVDAENRVQHCNPAFERLFLYREREIVGSNINDLVAPPQLREEAHQYTGHVAEGEYVHGTAVRRRSDGSLLDVEIYGVPLKLGDRFVGSFGLYQDITERKRAQEELERAKEAAEAGSRAKSEFLANMSHEIRTPMNGVLGMIELALDTELTAEQREYLGMVKSSADALLTVLNDILDFSKIEAGKLDLDPIAFKLRDHLAQSMKPLALRAHQKGLELTYEVHREVPDEVVADPSRLRQIIINLAGNAIKFTERGEVGIEVGVETQGTDRAELHFQVRDTGIGVAPEKQDLIFAAFSQADGTTARRFGGTGLGLTISSRLVEMMGGRIWLESELGKGSCFHFTMPVGVAGASAAPEPMERGQLAGLRVLVVDDNPTNRRILAEMLERWGMKAVTAESGVEAVAALEQAQESATPFALLLADVNMPLMDGFTLVERIRQQDGLRRTTIMMLTSVGQRGDAARCRQLGVAAYLIKPIGQSQLLDAILNVLGPKAREAEGARQPTGLVTRHSLREGQRKLRVLLAEDNAVNQRLASRLLEKRGHSVVVAGNGREALKALKEGEFDLVLMDVSMPEMDGLEAARAIRAAEQATGTHLPIIAMTAHAMKGDRERCLDAGMDGYVSKPVQARDLFQAAEAALSGAIRFQTSVISEVSRVDR